jgi:hypothetical protein
VFHWPEVGSFEIEGGERITVDRNAGVEEDLIRLPLLGPVLGAVLLQRRRLVLHASAVRIGQGAVAFVGVKGAGKSTMSAALHQKGYPVVTDDLLAVQQDEDDVHAHPAFPRFKLWPDAAVAALNDDPEQLKPLHARVQKRARAALNGFSTQPLPLKRIYILSRSETVDVEKLKGRRGLLDVLPHAYNNTLIDAIGSAPLRQWHFEACVALVQRVPIRILRRPRDLSRLHEVADVVVSEVSRPA